MGYHLKIGSRNKVLSRKEQWPVEPNKIEYEIHTTYLKRMLKFKNSTGN